jgi:hypothetical protein
MPKISSGYRFSSELIVTLGAVACILVWLGIKPADLHMTPTFPHVTWLIVGLILFALSIASSLYSIYSSRPKFAALQKEHEDEIKRMETVNNSELWRSNEVRKQLGDERKDALEEVRTLKEQLEKLRDEWDRKEKRLNADVQRAQEVGWERDNERREALWQLDEAKSQLALFSPLQMEAFQLSNEIAVLIRSTGNGEPRPPKDAPHTVEATAAYTTRLNSWTDKLTSRYALDYESKVRILIHRFAVEGIKTEHLGSVAVSPQSKVGLIYIARGLADLAVRMHFKEFAEEVDNQ